MSDRRHDPDRILDLIDAGLQSSDEASCGTEVCQDTCARCQFNLPADGEDLCAGCRRFLLDDSTEDPAADRPATVGAFPVVEVDEELWSNEDGSIRVVALPEPVPDTWALATSPAAGR